MPDPTKSELEEMAKLSPDRRDIIQAEIEAQEVKRRGGTVMAIVNNPTGVIDALADGVPNSPVHVDEQWYPQGPRYLHAPVKPTIDEENVVLGRE